jgi:hypothetical protein
MRGLIRWLCSWSRVRRYKARKHDVQFLFPAIWSVSGRDLGKFIDAVSLHTAMDPNWRGHEDEWRLTPADPGAWAADRMRKEVASRAGLPC